MTSASPSILGRINISHNMGGQYKTKNKSLPAMAYFNRMKLSLSSSHDFVIGIIFHELAILYFLYTFKNLN